MIMKKFCYCCRLQTGTLICAVISITATVTILVFSLKAVYNHCLTDVNDQIRKTLYYGGVIEFIVSVLLLTGASNESRYYLLPWMLCTAVVMTSTFLASVYYVFFGKSHVIINGVALFILSGVLLYATIGVTCYYCELRLRERSTNGGGNGNSMRTFLVTSRIGVSRPPSYNAVVGCDNPPTYEQARRARPVNSAF